MRITKFSVENYKVFKEDFSIEFETDSIAILTGKNNTGKSTLLEAINRFFMEESKTKTIPDDCFSDKSKKEIILKGTFELEDSEEKDQYKKVTIIKKYERGKIPKFYDVENNEIKKGESKEQLIKILANKPYYITPYMHPDDINELIQTIYSDVLKSNLEKLDKVEEYENEHEEKLVEEYRKLKSAYPEFLGKIKSNTDNKLDQVSKDVSESLKQLFTNDSLKLKVIGGESNGFSVNDLLKSTDSSVEISNHLQKKMPLSNQGTGLQRMALIYLIQNMIKNKMMGEEREKLLLIDEPEAFLHPEAVRALSKSLYSIGEKMPLMISTHSPILINLSEKHTSIQVFRVNQKQSKQAIDLFKSNKEQFEDDDIKNMKILNYVDSYVNEFFFADKILIVEGDTEYIAFNHLAIKENINLHIIRARGKGTIQTLIKILNQFNADYIVIHDVDNDPSFSLKTLRTQKTMCKNIMKLMEENNGRERRNIENRLFVSETTFETAIGIGKLSNSAKTKRAYEIINYTDEIDYKEEEMDISKEKMESENKLAFEKIKGLFDYIFKGIENTVFQVSDFHKITNENQYDDLFNSLILEKEKESIGAK